MDFENILGETKDRMENALDSLHTVFATVRTGRANAKVLDRVMVEYYGTLTPVNQIAGIKTPDARLLVIEPWDKGALKPIEKALLESDLGMMPSNDGNVIRLPFPELTEERRKELVKQCKTYCEEARVAIRNARRDANSAYTKLEKNGDITEDDLRGCENDVQKLTDSYIAKVDAIFKEKESELMEI